MIDSLTFNRRRVLGLAAGSVAGAALLSACTIIPGASASSPSTNLYLSMVSDAMTGKKNYPAFVPSDVTVPAHSTINARIVQFDEGAAALPENLAHYAKITGTVGGSAVTQPITLTDPNNAGASTTFQELAPTDVSHTFTVDGLTLNVPLPVSSIVSFSFQTGNPGTYTWMCMAPCGTSADGLGVPMGQTGYMMGTLHVV